MGARREFGLTGGNMPPAGAPRMWTIASSAPFLDRLAGALMDGGLVPGRHALADHLVLLPTRRACRGLAERLVARAGAGAVMLPRIRPIGDVDEVELALEAVEANAAAEDILDLPPAMEPTRRQVLLTELVLNWGRTVARTLLVPGRNEPVAIPVRPGDAALLARDLARLLDDFETEGRDFSVLGKLVPEDHAEYWKLTLAFLRIATEQWPRALIEEGRMDPAARRDALLRAEAARLTREPPPGPVIAAGSTGTIPATADLLAAIARLPLGAVVLPGLDTCMEDAAWDALNDAQSPHPGHPQFGLHRLLARIGIAREGVLEIGAAERKQREVLISEAMRPAATTERWADLADRLDAPARAQGQAGLAIVEAANEREEATAIALALREAIETPERTAALVTPDRALARRVSTELGRWGLAVDDSAGVPVAETPPGTLFHAIADAAAARLSPGALVALLQHPLACLGLEPGEMRAAARTLELMALRGPRPAPGSEGLLRVVAQSCADDIERPRHPVLRRIGRDARAAARDLAGRIADAFAPLEALADHGEVALSEMVAAHHAALLDIAAAPDGTCPALEGQAGEALDGLLGSLEEAAAGALTVSLDDYPALLGVLTAGSNVRPMRGGHPRLSILGPLEARLLPVDLVVLGGLNEGSWPADTRTDPFLNRPMRADAGLQAPERFIGLAAHDVAQLAATGEVIFTRAQRAGGEPTVASRWLQRLRAVVGKADFETLTERGARYLDWARRLDLSETRDAVGEPCPKPALEHRPKRLSVTEVETLIRDPYAIYARHVLGLEPLDELDAAPDAATRGILIHEAMERFDAVLRDGVPDDPVAELMAIGRELFRRIEAFPELMAIWWPRFVRVAHWFAPLDAAERSLLDDRMTELRGQLDLTIAGRDFTLAGRADRIDVSEGSLRIVDYKTGGVPSDKQVDTGLAPQLPLEAAMIRRGGFAGVPAEAGIAAFTYVALKGGDPPGLVRDVKLKEIDAAGLADRTLAQLEAMLARFADPDTAYRAKTHVQQLHFATDYDHLSRYPEWSVVDGGEG